MAIGATSNSNNGTGNQTNNWLFPFILVTSLFFFWGFVAASNTILIGLFKDKFDLQQWQSQLVEFAFYTAYFVGSLLYFLKSSFNGIKLTINYPFSVKSNLG